MAPSARADLAPPAADRDPCGGAHALGVRPVHGKLVEELAEAQAQLVESEQTFRRQRVLFDLCGTLRDLEAARAEWRAARNRVAQAECRLARYSAANRRR